MCPAVVQLQAAAIRLVRQSFSVPLAQSKTSWRGLSYRPGIEADSYLYDLYRPEHAANRRAAVLILLFEREGSLRVLLTTRSKNLRSHPGQTALPGGKYDEIDESLVATAVRITAPVAFCLLTHCAYAVSRSS